VEKDPAVVKIAISQILLTDSVPYSLTPGCAGSPDRARVPTAAACQLAQRRRSQLEEFAHF